jgi:hypothetical protein
MACDFVMSNVFQSASDATLRPFIIDDCADVSVQRIDGSHQRPVEDAKPAKASVAAPTEKTLTKPLESRSEFDPVEVRMAHADDLIEHLQRWSEELDERAARLHADIATHERRERSFRLWMQNRRAELEAKIAEYDQAKRQAEAIARRLAIGE